MKIFLVTFATVFIVDFLVFNMRYISFKVIMLCFILSFLNTIFINYLKKNMKE